MRRFAAFLLLLLLSCKGDPQPQPPNNPAAPQPKPLPETTGTGAFVVAGPAADLPAPLLWVVGGPNGTSYLQGTMHLGVDIRRDVHPIVFERLDASKTFVMETDISEVDPFEMSKLAELPTGITLDQTLTKQQWRGLTEILPSFPPDTLKRYRPWFALVAVTQTILPATQPMDGVLQRRASSGGLKLEYLEQWKYQIDVLNEVIGPADIAELVDNFGDTKKELLELAAGYKAGDPAVVDRIIYDPEHYKKNPKVLDLLIVKRNREWMPKLEAYIEAGHTFIAVGVGHLVGDQGVIAMLRKRGYTVERITLPQARERPATPAAAAQ